MNKNYAATLDGMLGNLKKTKTFDEALERASSLDRCFLIGDITPDVADVLDHIIRFWNKYDSEMGVETSKREPIKIYINSGGGDLVAGLTIIDSIKMSKTPVYTIVTGAAYSGGFFIASSGHKRFAYPRASFMYHEGSVGHGGDAGKFRNFTDFYKKQLDELKNITLTNTNISEALYEEHQKDDWWMNAEEALEHGVIDEIVSELI